MTSRRFLDRKTRGYTGWLLFVGSVALAVSHVFTRADWTWQEVITNAALLVAGLLMMGAIDGKEIAASLKAWRGGKE